MYAIFYDIAINHSSGAVNGFFFSVTTGAGATVPKMFRVSCFPACFLGKALAGTRSGIKDSCMVI